MAAKKFTPKPQPKKKDRGPLSDLDKVTLREIKNCAEHVHTTIEALGKPEMKFPDRSLKNARYDKKDGYFVMGRSRVERTLSVNTVKSFAQTLKMMALSQQLVDEGLVRVPEGGSLDPAVNGQHASGELAQAKGGEPATGDLRQDGQTLLGLVVSREPGAQDLDRLGHPVDLRDQVGADLVVDQRHRPTLLHVRVGADEQGVAREEEPDEQTGLGEDDEAHHQEGPRSGGPDDRRGVEPGDEGGRCVQHGFEHWRDSRRS